MELKRISIDSIVPDGNNPRSDFGDIRAFAETFRLNQQSPGEPYTPPIVVADGNVFRIADGERRWRAMREIGTEECNAIVCTDFDEADSVAMMLATDDKKELTDIERSTGVQRMLLLGCDTRTVETAARLKRGQAKRLKDAISRAGDEVLQASIDQILKASEIREMGGDDGDVAKVIEADPENWESVARELKAEIEQEQRLEDFTGYLASEGFELLEGHSEDTKYVMMFRDPDRLLEFLEENEDPRDGWEFVYCGPTESVDLYAPVEGEDGEVEGDRPNKIVDNVMAAVIEGRESRMAWYLASCKHGNSKARRLRTTMHVDKAIEAKIEEATNFRNGLDEFGVRPDELSQGSGIPGLAGAYLMRIFLSQNIRLNTVRRVVTSVELVDFDRSELEEWVDTVEPFMFDGWRMGDDERLFYQIACEALGRRPYDDGGAFGSEVPVVSEAKANGADGGQSLEGAPFSDMGVSLEIEALEDAAPEIEEEPEGIRAEDLVIS